MASLDRRVALDGADYVINAIQVGMHSATVRDFDIPASFGLRQTIGDTLGVGGIFRALRTFPVLEAIARDMAELCPDAWLLNYTNPMAMNVGLPSAVAPPSRSSGCATRCTGPRVVFVLIGVPYEEVTTTAPGSTIRPGCCAGSGTGTACTRCSTPRSPAIPNCAAGYA